MVTRLGVGSYTYGFGVRDGMTARAIADEAARLGAEVVQWCENVVVGPDDVAHAHALGLHVEIGTRGIETLPAAFALAELARASCVRLVIDRDGDEPTPQAAIARLRDWASRGPLAIENHDRFSAETLREIVKAIGAGVVLDTANSLGAQEGYREVVRTLAPYVVNLHVKDVNVRRMNHQMGFVVTGATAGEGGLDVPWILRTLDEAGATYSVILEQWPPEGGWTAQAERASAERGFAYLRRLIPH